MKALISKKYLNYFDMRLLTKEVHDLFDEYNFINELLNNNMIEKNQSPIHLTISSTSNSSSELNKLLKIEKYEKYIKYFESNLNYLKSNMTDDELLIYKYCIEEREIDRIVSDRICKSGKTYYKIKKSCYAKIAMKFNLATITSNESFRKSLKIKEA